MSQRLNVSLLSLLICLPAVSAHAAELYRWSDEKGNVHYTDRVPPEYVEQGYRVISEQGLTIKTIRSVEEMVRSENPKTDDIPPEQAEADRLLLLTYASEAEIIAARTRKLADHEALLTLNEETIGLLDTQFRELTRQASDFEKQGKSIPADLRQRIDSISAKIKQHQSLQLQRQEELLQLEQKFNRELARYQQLTRQPEEAKRNEKGIKDTSVLHNETEIRAMINSNKRRQEDMKSLIGMQEQAIDALELRFKELLGKAQQYKQGDKKIPQQLYDQVTSTKDEIIRHHSELLDKKKRLNNLEHELQGELSLLQIQKKMNALPKQSGQQ